MEQKKKRAVLSLKEFEDRVKRLFISKNNISDKFETVLQGFGTKSAPDQLSILDILIEKCSSHPERLQEFKQSGGYDCIQFFYAQSVSDESEENPDLFILGFQIIKLLLFLDKSGINDDAFKAFVDIFWRSSNLEIVMGALIYIRQMIEVGHDQVQKLIKTTSLETKLVMKWLWVLHAGDARLGGLAGENPSLYKEVADKKVRPLTAIEMSKLTEQIVMLFANRLEEHYLDFRPYLAVARSSVVFANDLTTTVYPQLGELEILSLHLRFHENLFKFISRDPSGFSVMVAEDNTFEEYFTLVLKSLIKYCTTLFKDANTDIIETIKSPLLIFDHIVRLLYVTEEKHKKSRVGSLYSGFYLPRVSSSVYPQRTSESTPL